MTKAQLADLTPREQRILSEIIRERDTYTALRRGIAARILNGTIWVQLLVIRRVDAGVPDTVPAPREPMVRKDDSPSATAQAINKLPDPHRMALRMRLLDEKSVDEISAELGMSFGEAEALLSEAGRKLRAVLALAAEPRWRPPL
jgi:DNA-directed RNA polymerase specialized sigma24 family protein